MLKANELHNLGVKYYKLDEYEKANESLIKALEISRKVADCKKEFTPYLLDTLYLLGLIKDVLNKPEEAKKNYEEIIESLRMLKEKRPKEYLPKLANALNKLGVLQERTEENQEEAENNLTEALKIREELATQYPEKFEFKVADTLNNLGILYNKLNKNKDAQGSYERALNIYQKSKYQQPDQALQGQAMILINLASLLDKLNEIELAKDNYMEALKKCRKLVDLDRQTYLPKLLEILNNFGLFFDKLNEVTAAKNLYQEAIEIYQELLEEDNSTIYSIDIASVYSNLGKLQFMLNELEQSKESFQKAIDIDLDKKNPEKYMCAIALNNFGLLLEQLNEIDEAKACYNKALDIYKEFKDQESMQALQGYAMTFCNKGNLYNKLNENKEALECYEKARINCQKLEDNLPGMHSDKLATTFNNLGNLKLKLGNIEEAEESYIKALDRYKNLVKIHPRIYLSYKSWTLNNLGALQYHLSETQKAEKFYQEALDCITKMKNLLSEGDKEHLDMHKGNIEGAVWGLLEFYYKENSNTAISLIETLRNAAVLAELSKDKQQENYILKDNEIVLSIQTTNKSYFFAVSCPKGHKIYKSEYEIIKLDNVFANLSNEIWAFWEGSEAGDEFTANKSIKEKGREAFKLLPEQIKTLLNSETKEQIYLSLDSTLINTPFEFLVNDNDEFIGQVHLLPRIQGISMLNKLKDNYKGVNLSGKKLLVGNPTQDLSMCDDEIKNLINAINNFNSKNISIFQHENALKENIIQELTEDLAIFHYSGHGTPPDGLKMADKFNNLYSRHLAGKKFTNNPLVFISSCSSGQTNYFRGGRFKGMNTVFLSLGAQAVISSVYPVFDISAMEFGQSVYKNFLNGQTVGEAVMSARKESDNVFEWGLHIFYGNPGLKIRQ